MVNWVVLLFKNAVLGHVTLGLFRPGPLYGLGKNHGNGNVSGKRFLLGKNLESKGFLGLGEGEKLDGFVEHGVQSLWWPGVPNVELSMVPGAPEVGNILDVTRGHKRGHHYK